MLVVNAIAITGVLVGIGGIGDAIEYGTSLVAPSICLLIGIVCMVFSYKVKGPAPADQSIAEP